MALADFQSLWSDQIKPSLPTKANVTAKADKVGTGHGDEIALYNSNGNLKTSGKTLDDLTTTYATDSVCEDIIDEL